MFRNSPLRTSINLYLLDMILDLELYSPAMVGTGKQSTRTSTTIYSWDKTVVSTASVILKPKSVEDVVVIMTDREQYPPPVRPIGFNLSTTPCNDPDGGTIVDMRGMNRILEVGSDYVRVEAGALYYDVARELLKHGLQFYVSIEMGNVSMGSAACGGTKDSAFPGEHGQVSSYLIGARIVTSSGEVLEIDETQEALLRIVRSSYGLLGVICDVTFKVKPIQRMSVRHVAFDLEGFLRELPSLVDQHGSVMYFIFPLRNRIIAELRSYDGKDGPANRRVWRLRNLAWKTLAPGFGHILKSAVPKPLQNGILNGFEWVLEKALIKLIHSRSTIPTYQIIRHTDKPGLFHGYLFSIWTLPEASFPEALREYFELCRSFKKEHGFRCNLPTVGYRVPKDDSSLFSYSYRGNIMTIDPSCTGYKGWEDFLHAYNALCSRYGGSPLFNQTKFITSEHVREAFGDRVDIFHRYRKTYDPDDRLLNGFFRDLLS